MSIIENLSLNLKFYRKKYNLSQEKFAEILGTTLSYLNQIENTKVDVKSSTIEKFTNNLNLYDKMLKLKSEELVSYYKDHITKYKRIDERPHKKNLS